MVSVRHQRVLAASRAEVGWQCLHLVLVTTVLASVEADFRDSHVWSKARGQRERLCCLLARWLMRGPRLVPCVLGTPLLSKRPRLIDTLDGALQELLFVDLLLRLRDQPALLTLDEHTLLHLLGRYEVLFLANRTYRCFFAPVEPPGARGWPVCRPEIRRLPEFL